AKDVEKRDFVGKLSQPIEHRVEPWISAWRPLERGLLGELLLQCLDDRTHFRTEGPLHHYSVAGTNGSEHSRLQRRRRLGIAAPGARGKSLPQLTHERSRTKNNIDAGRSDHICECTVQFAALRAELQHIAQN